VPTTGADTITIHANEAPASMLSFWQSLTVFPLGGARRTAPGSGSKPLTYWQSIATHWLQVADALTTPTSKGVLHRDIKPSNLLLDTGGTVWITDFGLAKADDQQNLTQTGDILARCAIMPPEAFDGPADARGDVLRPGLDSLRIAVATAGIRGERPQPAHQASDHRRASPA